MRVECLACEVATIHAILMTPELLGKYYLVAKKAESQGEIFEVFTLTKTLKYYFQNLPKVGTTYYGTGTVRFMDQRAWAKLPTEIKTSSSLTVLKNS